MVELVETPAARWSSSETEVSAPWVCEWWKGAATERGTAGARAGPTRQTKPATKSRLTLAAALDQHETTRGAMAAGRLGEDQPATLDTGHRISASQARKLACEANLIPFVLGDKSEILDLGRSRRFHNKAQRIAIAHRDRTRTALGCDWPAALSHVHHDIPWSRGGPTTVDDGRLLCPRHHTYAHSPAYEMTKTKHGRVTFTRQ